jgi:DNA-binding response OmpR family regulator
LEAAVALGLPCALEATQCPEVLAMRTCRVLIVDDNRSLADTVGGVLTDQGFEVDVVASGAGALVAWRSRPAELVLLDVDLPDIGGIRLARRLVGRRRCSLLVMSARDPHGLARQCRELGVCFLAKPFTPSRLLAAVRETLATAARAQEAARAAGTRRLLSAREPRGLLQHGSPRKRLT